MFKKIALSGFILIFIFIFSFFIILQLQKKEYNIIKESNAKQIKMLIAELNNKIESNINSEVEKLHILSKLITYDINNFPEYSEIIIDNNTNSFIMLISQEGNIVFTYPFRKSFVGFSILSFPDIANFFIRLKKTNTQQISFLNVKYFDNKNLNFVNKTFISIGITSKLVNNNNFYIIKFVPYNVFFGNALKKFKNMLGESIVIYLKDKPAVSDNNSIFEYNIKGLKYFVVIKGIHDSTAKSLKTHFKKINFLIILLISITFLMGAFIIFNLFASHKKLESLVNERTKELSIEKERYRLFFNYLPLAAIVYDLKNLQISNFNDNAANLGISKGKILNELINNEKALQEHLALVEKEGYESSVIYSADKRIFELHTIKLMDENKALSIINDITEQKAIEEKLQQAQKHEIINTITSGISHDFKNTINNIQIYLSLIEKNKENSQHYINTLKSIIMSAKEHIENLLTISHQRKPKTIKLTSEELMKNFIQLVNNYIPKNIYITYINLIPQAKLRIAKGSVIQAFLNIIINSVEAIGDNEGTISIIVDKEQINKQNFVKITFNDNGPGIKNDILKNILKPFYTTKENGCGLGLTLVDRVIKESGGFMNIESNYGEGTTIRIFLPEV
ncbi:two-component system sensor histidine kinase NtrB [Deferribacter abyssi]|uniref:two-component system sensor histidine kinase NtrB n=1 Tax=Deferribacter abyssi TaxID=213806 RepID=UPI003C1CCBFA